MEHTVDVVVIGAGMAGLSAAYHLSKRGYRVTVVEQNELIGGKYGVIKKTESADDDDYHEHCYHMLLNWYHNFWRIVDDLGLRQRFAALDEVKYIRRGEKTSPPCSLANIGSMQSLYQNIFSGVQSPADMYIAGYSLIDLLAQNLSRDKFLDRYSVNGFVRSRPYATEKAAELYQYTLAKAFANPSYKTSAITYQNFFSYGFNDPEPMMWTLKGNCYKAFLKPLHERLIEMGCDIRTWTRLKKITLDESGKIKTLKFTTLKRHWNPEILTETGKKPEDPIPRPDYVVLAVPPKALVELVDESIHAQAPELGEANNLNSETMASLDLCFNKKLDNIPKEHVVLLGSKYDLTFVDNSQTWPDEPNTYLNIVASDFDALASITEHQLGKKLTRREFESGKKHICDAIIAELQEFITFDSADIDWERSLLQINTGEALFVNEVGSWPHRPKTACGIPNLFIAGDYCQTKIDVVTIESAVISGMLAAEEIRKKSGRGEPIVVQYPEPCPQWQILAMLTLGAPWAYAAKTLSEGQALWKKISVF